jgi:cytochrome c553
MSAQADRDGSRGDALPSECGIDGPGSHEENTMKNSVLAAGLMALAGMAAAQQPPAPTFAPSNLTPAGVRALAANCSACHGTNGRAVEGSLMDDLAGKPKDDLLRALTQFKEGKKAATLMHQISKGYSGEELNAIAEYFSRLPR